MGVGFRRTGLAEGEESCTGQIHTNVRKNNRTRVSWKFSLFSISVG